MMRTLIICLTTLLLYAPHARAADTLKVLFIGNSFTAVNDLPEVCAQLAASGGDVLIKTSQAPGGATLQSHSTNANTLQLIAQQGWDVVVLQEQSQLPAFPDDQVATDVYPYAELLDSLIHAANPCAKTMFYMTWGYRNGDASNCAGFPAICTYQGMDSMIRLRYTIMAQNNAALLSPAGAVWHAVRDAYPLLDLYAADNMHPGAAGTYAAACAFYAVLFGKDPALLSYNFTVPAADAAGIRQIASAHVYDSLAYWSQFSTEPTPVAGFSVSVAGLAATFNNASSGADAYQWNYGDGGMDTAQNPVHQYAAAGTYPVQLIATGPCGKTDTFQQTVSVLSTAAGSVSAPALRMIYPNPATDYIVLPQTLPVQDYSVYTMSGSLVISIPAGKNQRIEVGSWPRGCYIIKGAGVLPALVLLQ